jgi:hypothetical protein
MNIVSFKINPFNVKRRLSMQFVVEVLFLTHLHLASVIVGGIVNNFYILLFSSQSEATEPIGTKTGRNVH